MHVALGRLYKAAMTTGEANEEFYSVLLSLYNWIWMGKKYWCVQVPKACSSRLYCTVQCLGVHKCNLWLFQAWNIDNNGIKVCLTMKQASCPVWSHLVLVKKLYCTIWRAIEIWLKGTEIEINENLSRWKARFSVWLEKHGINRVEILEYLVIHVCSKFEKPVLDKIGLN